MVECLDDVVADCLAYFHVDITSLWSYEAVRLVERVHRYWHVVPESEPPRVLSAVYAHVDDRRAAEAEGKIMSGDELKSLGFRVKEV